MLVNNGLLCKIEQICLQVTTRATTTHAKYLRSDYLWDGRPTKTLIKMSFRAQQDKSKVKFSQISDAVCNEIKSRPKTRPS